MLTHLLAASCLLSLTAGTAAGQASYIGKLSGAPIELLVAPLSSGTGVYLYTKIGTPIILRSDLRHGVLTLTEYAADRLLTTQSLLSTKYKPVATLTIAKFSFDAPVLRGTWRSLATGKQLPLALTLVAGPNDAGTAAAPPTALQNESTPLYYFKTLLTGKASDPATRVGAVQVIEKKTNRVLQQFPVNCRAIGQGSVSVDDYNFDGMPDFSIYEDDHERPHFAGSNTTSQYFLYDPTTRQFVASDFQGIGLTFDAKKKRVYECTPAPTRLAMTKAEYRVLDNHLVLVAKRCFDWDINKGFVVSEPSACQ